ncbi:MAG: hypothetical protein WAT33_00005 [Giesbergeria sp.]|jgi:hypothetical protein
MTPSKYDRAQLEDLVLQMMETELGGEKIYRAAIATAVNGDLKEEWQGYLKETLHHQDVVRGLCATLGLNADQQSPTRTVVRHIGKSLVQAIEMAQRNALPAAAQVVAAECVVLAETKDHSNWELLGRVAEVATGDIGKAFRAAHEDVEQDEDHHLFHTKGWMRELAIQGLGMPAVLPPPEEVKQVETAIGASRAEQARSSML